MTDLTIEEQREITRLARKVLGLQLKRFGWTAVPRKTDPEGEAFRTDLEAQKALRASNIENSRLYRMRHPEKCREVGQLWRGANLKRIAEGQRRRRQANLEKDARIRHRWYEANLAKVAEIGRRWHAANPDKVLEYSRRRRARLADADGEFTEEGFQELCIALDYTCFYCGRGEDITGPLVPDHVTPISRGGSNWLDNIIPACGHCNDSKGDKTLDEFLDYLEGLKEVK